MSLPQVEEEEVHLHQTPGTKDRRSRRGRDRDREGETPEERRERRARKQERRARREAREQEELAVGIGPQLPALDRARTADPEQDRAVRFEDEERRARKSRSRKEREGEGEGGEGEDEARQRRRERRERRRARREERERRRREKEENDRARKVGTALPPAEKKDRRAGLNLPPDSEIRRFHDELDSKDSYITLKAAKQAQILEKKTMAAKKNKYTLPEKTTLYQGRIRYPSEAPEIFQTVTFTKVPLVLIPDDRNICSLPWFFNPSGHYGITQSRGVSPKELTKEGKNYGCSWTRVAYCVSQQSTTYSCPVRKCPTFDNVNIDVNIKLIFRIGGDPQDVRNFAYMLGASRFDEFLHVSVQEAIRTLVRSSYWSEARDLFHTHPGVKAILKGLNKIFNYFGVFFEQSIITDVVFSNPELRHTLEETTAFQSKVKEHVESHQFRIKVSQLMLQRHMAQVERQHQLNLQHIGHERKILEAKRREIMVDLEREREVALVEANRKMEETLIRAEAECQVAVRQATADMQPALLEGEKRGKVIQTLQDGVNGLMASEAELYSEELRAKAKMINAAAEEKAMDILRYARRHELRGKKCDMLKEMAGSRHIVISGERGDQVLEALLAQGYRRASLAQ
eukprot:g77585.t1